MMVEEHFEYPAPVEKRKKKLNLEKVFADDAFVRMNTKADLVYMDELQKQLDEKAKTDAREKARLLKVQ